MNNKHETTNLDNERKRNNKGSQETYFEFKLKMLEKTIDVYLKRMDIWEEWFFKVKYGCITIVVILLGFKYTYAKENIFLNLIALATTLGLWIFEAVLRTTFFRYMARWDILAETINNRDLMVKAFESKQLDEIKILDLDVRTEKLENLIDIAFHYESEKERKKRKNQKKKFTSIWSSINLKNVRFFYGAIILLQLLVILFLEKWN